MAETKANVLATLKKELTDFKWKYDKNKFFVGTCLWDKDIVLTFYQNKEDSLPFTLDLIMYSGYVPIELTIPEQFETIADAIAMIKEVFLRLKMVVPLP